MNANNSSKTSSSSRKSESVQNSNSVDFGKKAVIRAIGVGGGGCNAINRMVTSGVKGVDFIAVNTDNQALENNKAETRVRIGDKITRGLGAGADPEVGAKAATESRDEISALLRGTDLLFVTAGMGGGTGTGAAPVIAQVAQDMGILTVAVVTKPFRFEGSKRSINAENGIQELQKYVDSLIIVPNDKLLDIADEDTTVDQAFAMADHVLRYGITGISDLVAVPGLINLDMADVRRVMIDAGICHMGIGRAQGPDRVEDAIDEAIHSPLLDSNIDGAKKIIINFTGSSMKIREVAEAASLVRDSAHPSADIIIGAVLDEDLDDEIMITIIASGFEENSEFDPEFEADELENFDTSIGAGRKSSASDLAFDTSREDRRPRSTRSDLDYSSRREDRSERERTSYRDQSSHEEYTPNYKDSYSDSYDFERKDSASQGSYRSRDERDSRSRLSSRSRDYDSGYSSSRESRDSSTRTRSNGSSSNKQGSKILPWLFNDDEK